MGKTKNKNHSELEGLRGYCRELEKENRSLRKELRRYEKYEQHGQDTEVSGDSEDTMEIKPKLTKCEDCGKGYYKEFEIMNKVYGTCGTCEHRKRLR